MKVSIAILYKEQYVTFKRYCALHSYYFITTIREKKPFLDQIIHFVCDISLFQSRQ